MSDIYQNEVRWNTKKMKWKCASHLKSEVNRKKARRMEQGGSDNLTRDTHFYFAKDCATHSRARLILSCVMGRLKSLASTTQYITLDKEFRIGNCFPLHAQIVIKNNKCHPSMSPSVFLYQSLTLIDPPPLHGAFINLSPTHRSFPSSAHFHIGFTICLSSSWTSIPINFWVGCFVCYHCHPSITPTTPVLSLRQKLCFFKQIVHFHLPPWWLSKMKLQISCEGENCLTGKKKTRQNKTLQT